MRASGMAIVIGPAARAFWFASPSLWLRAINLPFSKKGFDRSAFKGKGAVYLSKNYPGALIAKLMVLHLKDFRFV